MNVGVVDYDAGNLRSVDTALSFLSFDHVVSNDAETLANSDVLIVPGVGHAATAMNTLRAHGLDEVIREHARSGKKLIGICLGCQLFVERSEEGDTEGGETECLGLLEGDVVRFPNRPGMKVPHMGWNQLRISTDSAVYRGVPDGSSFYFVHSFYVTPESAPDTIGLTDYAERFTSVLSRDNIIAFQFHPEKSGPYGLRLLSNAIGGE